MRLMANEINSQSIIPRDPLSYIKKNVDSSLFMSYTSASEIFECISKLENKKSSGYDCISNSVLKSTNQAISPYLEILFNCCIYHGTFPDVFKIGDDSTFTDFAVLHPPPLIRKPLKTCL